MSASSRFFSNWASSWNLLKRALRGDTQYDYTSGSLTHATFLLAVPTVIEMSMESIFALVDIYFVRQLGQAAVATVGLTEAVMTLLYAVALGLAMGTTAFVARRIGEKNHQAASNVAAQAIWIGVIISLLVAAVGWFFSADILRLMGAEAEVLELGSGYTRIMMLGSFTIMLLFICNAIFRGAGDASLAMRVLLLANGINIVLDPCLIFGWGPFPALGVEGAAIATCIGRGVGVLYGFYHFSGTGNKDRIRLRLADWVWRLHLMKQLLQVSAGGIFQFLVAMASWIFLVRIIAEFGTATMSSYTIAIRIVMFTLLPAWGLTNAVATLVGQNLGAKKPQRAESAVWQIARLGTVYSLFISLLMLIFPEHLMAIIETSPALIEQGAQCLRILAVGFPLWVIGMCVIQAFNGAGATWTPTGINLLCFWVVQIPLAYGVTQWLGWGAAAVYWVVVVADSLVFFVGMGLFLRGSWKLKQV